MAKSTFSDKGKFSTLEFASMIALSSMVASQVYLCFHNVPLIDVRAVLARNEPPGCAF